MKMIVTIQAGNFNIDLKVIENQRISDVLCTLKECGKIFFNIDKIVIYSVRQNTYINKLLTFKQAGIFEGDVLELR